MKSVKYFLLLFTMFVLCFVFMSNFLILAQERFPKGPITLLNGYPPGGSSFVECRFWAEIVGKYLGQRVLVESKEGLNSGVMTGYLSRQKPDGYTIGRLTSAGLISNCFLATVDYDFRKDFTYIMGVGYLLNAVCVRKDAPWKTFTELVEYARKNPGKIRYASYAPDSAVSFGMRLIAKQQQINWVHVPYKGEGPSITSLLGGHVEAVGLLGGLMPYVKSGDLRCLVVFNKKRFSVLPDIPTIYELGYNIPPVSDIFGIHGVAAPKGLTGEPFEKLVSAFKTVVAHPGFKNMMDEIANPIEIMDSREFERQLLEAYKVLEEILPPLLKEIREKK